MEVREYVVGYTIKNTGQDSIGEYTKCRGRGHAIIEC